MHVVLVTCLAWPELSASDRLYAEALEHCGVSTAAAPWNGPPDPFVGADLVVLRSNWDYHHDLAGFTAWLDALERAGTRMLNAPSLVRWNLEKRYLLDLERRGVRVPKTEVVPGDPSTVASVLARHGWAEAVVKPLVGASGHGVRLVRSGESLAAEGIAAVRGMVVVQEYLPEVAQSGEVSYVFFDARYSHAVLKRPAPGDFRVNSDYQGTIEPFQPDPSLVRQARAVLDALPETPLYARVDGVTRNGALLVTELEVNEPSLSLALAPGSAARFADATVRRLRTNLIES
ncbi:MAG TPA: glutathione synthetase [Chloroflexota bacterium]|nr:glutathione synthetase [Chloroflexota bacterium]